MPAAARNRRPLWTSRGSHRALISCYTLGVEELWSTRELLLSLRMIVRMPIVDSSWARRLRRGRAEDEVRLRVNSLRSSPVAHKRASDVAASPHSPGSVKRQRSGSHLCCSTLSQHLVGMLDTRLHSQLDKLERP